MTGSHGLARILSKLGFCSRAEAVRLIQGGRVRLNGRVCLNPEQRTHPTRDRIDVDGQPVGSASKVYLMLNKPRGLVTTASDERGRPTVFDCLRDASLPAHVSPVGRLDQASEGLLLFTNDTAWAARLTDPAAGVEKTYHVQVDQVLDQAGAEAVLVGVKDAGEQLRARAVTVLRGGGRNTWLEVVLDEGKNRHLRRLCGGLGWEVLRLVRVKVGALMLGDLPKGRHRRLEPAEVEFLAAGGGGGGSRRSPRHGDGVRRAT